MRWVDDGCTSRLVDGDEVLATVTQRPDTWRWESGGESGETDTRHAAELAAELVHPCAWMTAWTSTPAPADARATESWLRTMGGRGRPVGTVWRSRLGWRWMSQMQHGRAEDAADARAAVEAVVGALRGRGAVETA